MPSRPDKNQEYVNRSAVKRWLSYNARPSIIAELFEITDNEADRRMLSDIHVSLVGWALTLQEEERR